MTYTVAVYKKGRGKCPDQLAQVRSYEQIRFRSGCRVWEWILASQPFLHSQSC